MLAGSALNAGTATPLASFTTEQAYRGRLQYYASCAECHGGKLEGVFGPALAGRNGNLQYQSIKGVYGYMAAHMPHGNPESLPQDQYIAIMAFLMQSHGFVAGSRRLTKAAIDADATLLGDPR
jgi:polar amino acid transport system substrate-binding protein